MLLPTWQSCSKQILIGGFQKGRICPCISRDTKVTGCQTFFIFQKLHFSFYIPYYHMKTAPPMKTFDFFKYRGSSHNAVLPQRGFPSYTDVLVLVRGGVRTFYLINSSNTVFFSRLKNQCYRRIPCTILSIIYL